MTNKLLMSQAAFALSEIAKLIGAELKGDAQCQITGIAPLYRARQGEISFLTNPQLRSHLKNTQASAVILSADHAKQCQSNVLVMDNPYLGFAKAAELFTPKPSVTYTIHPTAIIGKDCKIDPCVDIGAHSIIGDRVKIGKNTLIRAGCIIGDDCTIGENCQLFPRVTFYSRVTIGNRVWIHSGAVIGSDGFGLANDNGVWRKIPQLGGVVIGDDVEIGANTTIDRGALDNTVIENGVKLDNLIQVAHNVHIGEHTAIAACTGIAGSTHIGKRCMIGGGASIVGHIKIADDVVLVGTATVERAITEPGAYASGTGLLPFRGLKRLMVRLRQLDDMAHRIKELEKAKNEYDGS